MTDIATTEAALRAELFSRLKEVSDGTYCREQIDPLSLEVVAHFDALHARIAEMESESCFMIDRLNEAERDMADDDFGRQYNGHVLPSKERLQAILAKHKSATS